MRPPRTPRTSSILPTSTRHLLLVGVVLLLVVAGRDLTRAAHASAAPLPGPAAVAVALDAATDEGPAVPAPDQRSHRKVACGVGVDIARLQGHEAALGLVPTLIAELLPPAVRAGGPAAAAPPTICPGVFRALLQVYRI